MVEIAPVAQNGVISTQVEHIQRTVAEETPAARAPEPPPPPAPETGRGETVDVTA